MKKPFFAVLLSAMTLISMTSCLNSNSSLSQSPNETKVISTQPPKQLSLSQEYNSQKFAISMNTKIIHFSDCKMVKLINTKDLYYTDERCDTLVSRGYKKCPRCHPDDSYHAIEPKEEVYCKDHEVNEIIKRYNQITPLDPITPDQVTSGENGAGHATYVDRGKIRYEFSYAETYLNIYCVNEGVSKEEFADDMADLMASYSPYDSIAERDKHRESLRATIEEAMKKTPQEALGDWITCDGKYFHYYNLSWG